MRWPWSGIQDELRLLREQHERHEAQHRGMIEEHRLFTAELVLDMRRWSDRKDRELDSRLDKIVSEQRAQREVLFRMLDRLGPATGET